MTTITLKRQKVQWLYWALTAPFVITMLMAGVMLLSGSGVNVEGMAHLGYPFYVCYIIGTAKVLAGISILQNRFHTLKEWAYAGYTFNLIGAAASHTFSGDAFVKIISPVVILALVLGSYLLWKKQSK